MEEAIGMALESRWEEALSINRSLIDRHGPDEDAYNRIGKALSELGRHREAIEAYSESLAINPLNAIAQKNIRKLTVVMEGPAETAGASRAIDVDLFAEEPGRSALTVLSPEAQRAPLAITPGDPVELKVEGTALVAHTERGVALGRVEAKLSRRLLPLIATGNRYAAAVARVEDGTVEIMIREAYQAPENSRKSSFPVSRAARAADFRPYAKESLLIARELEGPLEVSDDLSGRAPEAEDDALDLPVIDSELEDASSLDDEDDKDLDDDIRPEDEY